MRPILAAACLSSAAVLLGGERPAAQNEPTRTLLARTAAYLHHFVRDLSNVVAQEQYVQEFLRTAGRRRLTSDFLLVGYPGAEGNFLVFRDVVEVNGRPVGDQQERLTRLFLQPFTSAVQRAYEIERDSVRYGVPRGRLSNPLLAATFLQEFYQPMFRFEAGSLDTNLGPAVRSVRFEEIERPRPGATPRLLRGTAWIDEGSGRVVRTELDGVTTTFGTDPGLGIDVPLEMRDTYTLPILGTATGSDRFIGRATYSRFRRFQVRTDEAIEKPGGLDAAPSPPR